MDILRGPGHEAMLLAFLLRVPRKGESTASVSEMRVVVRVWDREDGGLGLGYACVAWQIWWW